MAELSDFATAESRNVDPLAEEAKRRGAERAKHIEEKPITEQDALREMFKHARESELRYEVFQGEKMADNEFRSLTATIENALNERKKALVDSWIMNHPQDVQERTYGTGQLSDADKLDLVREKEGEEFFENDDWFRRLAAVSESLGNSNGQPNLESGLISFSTFEDIQRNLERKFAGNLQDPAFLAERRRNLAVQEALYKSVYTKTIAFNETKAQQDAINDPRVTKDFSDLHATVNSDSTYTEKRALFASSRNPISIRPDNLQIAALESLGYEVRPVKKIGWLTGREKNVIKDVEVYDKEGKKVSVNMGDIMAQFTKNKLNEFSIKYLEEYNDKEKLIALQSLSLRDPNELSRLSENLERKTLAELITKKELIRAKKENPEEAKHYQEVLKDKGVNVSKMIGDVLDGGEKSKFFKDFKGESEDELRAFFREYDQSESYADKLPEFARTGFMDTLKKAKKGGIMRWVFATINIISQLEKLAQV